MWRQGDWVFNPMVIPHSEWVWDQPIWDPVSKKQRIFRLKMVSLYGYSFLKKNVCMCVPVELRGEPWGTVLTFTTGYLGCFSKTLNRLDGPHTSGGQPVSGSHLLRGVRGLWTHKLPCPALHESGGSNSGPQVCVVSTFLEGPLPCSCVGLL